MSGIVYAGKDFSELCSAEVVERAAHAVSFDAFDVPGRAGARLSSSRAGTMELRVRLFLDPGFDPGPEGLSLARRRLRSWLFCAGGGELSLPDEPGLFWRDALCTDAGEWDSLFSDGSCEVTFTLLDPVAYGRERTEAGSSFTVGGTWRTWPTFSLTAEEGGSVCVTDASTGDYVLVEREFAGGETVTVGCEAETCEVDGEDARAEVALGSDFFALEPGDASLELAGCTSCTTSFYERWL